MKKYQVTFNQIGSKFPTMVYLDEERMQALYDAMNRGIKIVELDGNYFNTSYFVQAVPAIEEMQFRVAQDKLVEKGLIKTPEEIQKRIQATKDKYRVTSEERIENTKTNLLN